MNEVAIIAALITVAIGAAAMLRTIGTLSRDEKRLNALQDNGWQVGYIDGHFAVLGGSPPKIIGSAGKDVREVIDAAILERNHG